MNVDAFQSIHNIADNGSIDSQSTNNQSASSFDPNGNTANNNVDVVEPLPGIGEDLDISSQPLSKEPSQASIKSHNSVRSGVSVKSATWGGGATLEAPGKSAGRASSAASGAGRADSRISNRSGISNKNGNADDDDDELELEAEEELKSLSMSFTPVPNMEPKKESPSEDIISMNFRGDDISLKPDSRQQRGPSPGRGGGMVQAAAPYSSQGGHGNKGSGALPVSSYNQTKADEDVGSIEDRDERLREELGMVRGHAQLQLDVQTEDENSTWYVRLFAPNFPANSGLYTDMQESKRNGNTDSVQLELSFPANYPIDPPFVRVTAPRFKWHTGCVTWGGAIAIETLVKTGTKYGYKPHFTVSFLLYCVITNMTAPIPQYDQSPGRIDFEPERSPERTGYDLDTARENFKEALYTHGWDVLIRRNNPDTRPVCWYAPNCYRKNPHHWKMVAHPNQSCPVERDDVS
eukprot:Nk52_evm2s1737 gene=Nk52_evmTU2s1737